MLKNIKEILILALILIVAYQFIFPSVDVIEKPIIETVTTTDTLYVDVITEKKIYVPKYTTKIDTVIVPTFVDTVAIIQDYYTEYVYEDTLSIDSLGYGYLSDTISMNRITSRQVFWNYKFPVITNTIETTITLPPKRTFQFYVGATIGGDKSSINYFGPSIGFKTKSNKLFTVGAGIVGTDNIGMTFSAYYKFNPFK